MTEPGTAIPEEAMRAAIDAAYEFVPKAGDLGEVMARAVLAAAVPLLGLAAQADTDEGEGLPLPEWVQGLTHQECENGKHPEWFVNSERHHRCPWCAITAAEAEIDALRVQLDQAQAALAAVEAELVEWERAVEPDGGPSMMSVRGAASLMRAALTLAAARCRP